MGAPPVGTSDAFSYLHDAWLHAASGGVLIPLAIWLRRRHEAAAFALLAGACLLAGWAIEAVLYGYEAPGRLVWSIDLLAGLALVPAPAAVVAAFASTPERRLADRSPVMLGVMVAISVAAVVGQSAVLAVGSSFGGLGQTLVDWFSSTLVTLAVVVIAVAGSIRNEARSFVPSSTVARRDPTVPRRLGYFVIAALTTSALAAAGGFQSAPAAQGHTLLPLLAVLAAVIATRWSAYVAWSAVAVSLGAGAAVIFAGAVEAEVRTIVQDPQAPWAPTAGWLLIAGLSLALAVLGIAAACSALLEARNAGADDAHGAPGAWTLTAIAAVVAAWATAIWLVGRLGREAPLLEGPFWAVSMTITVLAGVLLLGGAQAVRARLVPAVAEAEAAARHPLRPFRYLETVAIETLTARAATRRSAVAAERSRLASDLHAQILPSLADIRTRYESGAPEADVAARLRELEREVRDLMAERRLVLLEEFGIVEAIEWLVGRAEERASMDVLLSVDDRSTSLRPPREVERAAFRIAQLAVENALQHASPTHLELQVLARSDEVRISVVDDGRGLRAAGDRGRDHVGISDMRTQAAEVRGDVTVVSPASGGTMVTFAWPAT
jgi:signal transduction histidine kinase